jgi:23S rRNA-/tRNA-specific pseudouridylate synthase
VNKDYLIKQGDVITHNLMRKEGKVLNIPIEIIFEDEDYLVVNKPPSIPVKNKK